MSEIPCRQCLKYAMCKHRAAVTCSDLNRFLHHLFLKIKIRKMDEIERAHPNKIPAALPQNHKQIAWDETWDHIHCYLPNVRGIYHG